MNNNVLALAVDPSRNLYAGGDFTTAGGVSAKYVAEFGNRVNMYQGFSKLDF